MPNQKLNRSSDWRCRREEYLRASDRREDLIGEGYESPGPAAGWVVIPGGERRSPKGNSGIRLLIVKGGAS
jgi:hypothetical protein